MVNTGASPWNGDENITLTSQSPKSNANWGMSQVWLDPGESIPPGESKTFGFPVTAPSTPGTYVFQWQMTSQDGTQVFGDVTPGVAVVVQSPGN